MYVSIVNLSLNVYVLGSERTRAQGVRAYPTRCCHIRRCFRQSKVEAMGSRSARITGARPCSVRGRKRTAFWMSGARYNKFLIWLPRLGTLLQAGQQQGPQVLRPGAGAADAVAVVEGRRVWAGREVVGPVVYALTRHQERSGD